MEIAGAQRMLLSQATWFASRGYMVEALFIYDKQGLQEQWASSYSFPVLSLDGRTLGKPWISNLLQIIRAAQILFNKLRSSDVVITYTPHSNLFGLPVAWLAGVRERIGTHHGHIEGSTHALARLHGWLTNSWICTKMVAVSSQVRDYAVQKEGASIQKLVVIENGVEPVELAMSDLERTGLRRDLGIEPGQLLILTVGRLTEQKGHIFLLDAAAKLVSKKPEFKLVFAGDGPKQSTLKAKVDELGLTETVLFLGVRHDVPRLLAVADIFVQPSLWEGLSLALLESLFAKLPVLATRVEGTVDVVEDGITALLVPPGNPDSLAISLRRLITDPDLRRKLADAGYQRAKNSYSIDAMCEAYQRLISENVNA